VPSGSLRRAVTYPRALQDWTLDETGQAPDKVGLGHKEKIEQKCLGGEKQRLAFARLPLHNPDIIVLDEATSACWTRRATIMERLTGELPKAAILSVAHRAQLETFHCRKIVRERRKGRAHTCK
jgi:putative ATP-binding cassette transporter